MLRVFSNTAAVLCRSCARRSWLAPSTHLTGYPLVRVTCWAVCSLWTLRRVSHWLMLPSTPGLVAPACCGRCPQATATSCPWCRPPAVAAAASGAAAAVTVHSISTAAAAARVPGSVLVVTRRGRWRHRPQSWRSLRAMATRELLWCATWRLVRPTTSPPHTICCQKHGRRLHRSCCLRSPGPSSLWL